MTFLSDARPVLAALLTLVLSACGGSPVAPSPAAPSTASSPQEERTHCDRVQGLLPADGTICTPTE